MSKEHVDMSTPVIEMRNIVKKFGDFVANDGINLTVHKGEIHAILGENGAGKSTLMNVLFGLYQPTEGEIYIRGQKVRIESPAQAVKLGIGMVHQHSKLVPSLTVYENIMLGIESSKKSGNFRTPFIDTKEESRQVQELIDSRLNEMKAIHNREFMEVDIDNL